MVLCVWADLVALRLLDVDFAGGLALHLQESLVGLGLVARVPALSLRIGIEWSTFLMKADNS
jgi:hypothetical protein